MAWNTTYGATASRSIIGMNDIMYVNCAEKNSRREYLQSTQRFGDITQLEIPWFSHFNICTIRAWAHQLLSRVSFKIGTRPGHNKNKSTQVEQPASKMRIKLLRARNWRIGPDSVQAQDIFKRKPHVSDHGHRIQWTIVALAIQRVIRRALFIVRIGTYECAQPV